MTIYIPKLHQSQLNSWFLVKKQTYWQQNLLVVYIRNKGTGIGVSVLTHCCKCSINHFCPFTLSQFSQVLTSLSSPAIHAEEHASTKKLVGNALALNLVRQLFNLGAIDAARAPGTKKPADVVSEPFLIPPLALLTFSSLSLFVFSNYLASGFICPISLQTTRSPYMSVYLTLIS